MCKLSVGVHTFSLSTQKAEFHVSKHDVRPMAQGAVHSCLLSPVKQGKDLEHLQFCSERGIKNIIIYLFETFLVCLNNEVSKLSLAEFIIFARSTTVVLLNNLYAKSCKM